MEEWSFIHGTMKAIQGLISGSILLFSCATEQTCLSLVKIKEECVPISAYKSWNECMGDCNIKLNPKTKPYKPEMWIRPRPYAYP